MQKLAGLQRFGVELFAGVLCLFFAEIFSAQILGLLGIYRLWTILPATVILAVAAFITYFKWGSREFFSSLPDEVSSSRWFDLTLAALGILILTLTVLLPVARWPFSSVSETLHWDAGAYHFPKAVELFRTGSVWNFSIPYGEFPFGYESLLAFGLSLTRNEALFGVVHALIDVLAVLSIWLLARRWTRLPGGLLFFLTALVFTSELITTKINPFYIFLDQAHMIGKNDLLLAAGVLAVLFHAPIGREPARNIYHLPGMVFGTLIVLATKPAGMFAVIPLWLLVAWDWLQQRRLPWKELAFAAVFILPGGLWLVRNLIGIKTFFPEGVWVMNEWSIVRNLTNPFFYAHLPRNFQFLLVVFAATLVFAVWKKVPTWRVAAGFGVFLVAFAFTPESAFQKTTQEPTRVAWRLGIALVAYEVLMIFALSEGMLARAAAWLKSRKWLLMGLVLVLAGSSGYLLWSNRLLMRYIPGNDIVLRDEFRDPVGTQGYHSVYDYVQKNIRGAVIQIEGGVFYYLYGPGYTNSPTKLQYPLGRSNMVEQLSPQYFVLLKRSQFRPGEEFLKHWKWLYEDNEAVLYQLIE